MITGKTRLYGIIGHPVGHVRVPMTFNERFARDGIDAVSLPFDAAPERFADQSPTDNHHVGAFLSCVFGDCLDDRSDSDTKRCFDSSHIEGQEDLVSRLSAQLVLQALLARQPRQVAH